MTIKKPSTAAKRQQKRRDKLTKEKKLGTPLTIYIKDDTKALLKDIVAKHHRLDKLPIKNGLTELFSKALDDVISQYYLDYIISIKDEELKGAHKTNKIIKRKYLEQIPLPKIIKSLKKKYDEDWTDTDVNNWFYARNIIKLINKNS